MAEAYAKIIIVGKDEASGAFKKVRESVEQLDRASKSTNASVKKALGEVGLSSSLFKQFTAAGVASNLLTQGLFKVQAAAQAAFTAPLRLASDFETTMARISTVVEGSTAESIKALGDEILALSTKFPKSADELGMGLYAILQAGVEDSADAMKLLEASTKAAIGGVTEVGVASKVLTDIMGAYNLTADQTVGVLDSIFVGAQRGKAEFADLAGSMGRTMGSAAQLNVGIAEVVSAIETMANAGFSAEMAATSLNAFLNSVIKASKGNNEAAETAKRLGLEYNSAALKAMGLQKFIEEVTAKAGNSEIALQSLTGDVRAFRAVAALAGKGGDFFNETLEEMATQTGATEDAFQKNASTLKNQWQIAVNRVNKLLTETGQERMPAVKRAVDALSRTISENEENIKKLAGALSATLVKAMEAAIATVGFLSSETGAFVTVTASAGLAAFTAAGQIVKLASALKTAAAAMATYQAAAGASGLGGLLKSLGLVSLSTAAGAGLIAAGGAAAAYSVYQTDQHVKETGADSIRKIEEAHAAAIEKARQYQDMSKSLQGDEQQLAILRANTYTQEANLQNLLQKRFQIEQEFNQSQLWSVGSQAEQNARIAEKEQRLSQVNEAILKTEEAHGKASAALREFAASHESAVDSLVRTTQGGAEQTEESAEDMAGALGGAAEESADKLKKVKDAMHDLGRSYGDIRQKVGEDLRKLAAEHQESMQAIKADIDDVVQSLGRLRDEHAKTLRDIEAQKNDAMKRIGKDEAGAYVSERDAVRAIEQELADMLKANPDLSIDKVVSALNNRNDKEGVYAEKISQADKALMHLTDTEEQYLNLLLEKEKRQKALQEFEQGKGIVSDPKADEELKAMQTELAGLQSQVALRLANNKTIQPELQKRIDDLQKEIQARQGAGGPNQDFLYDVREAERRNGLTDFQRSIEDSGQERIDATKEYKDSLKEANDLFQTQNIELENNRIKLEAKKQAEEAAYAAARSQMSLTLAALDTFETDYTVAMENIETVTEDVVKSMKEKLEELQQTIASIDALLAGNPGVTGGGTIADRARERLNEEVPGRATGGIVTEPFTLVGERGPEIVSLPRGSRVNTAGETRRMMGTTITNNFGPFYISKEVDSDGVIQKIKRAIELQRLQSA